MRHHVFLAGWPKTVGGGNTEAWHSIRLWLRNGCRVTVIPTWTASEPIRTRLETLGAEVCCASPETLASVPGLPGGLVVVFANERFLAEAHRFRMLGCRIAFASCMAWPLTGEDEHYRAYGLFDTHICQSEYQRRKIVPHLRCPDFHDGVIGRPDVAMIPGAFEADQFPLNPLPHHPGERFVIGRLSRSDPGKFPLHASGPLNMWRQFERIPYPTSVRIMGWSDRAAVNCGPPPKWAEVMPENAETTQEFLGKIHALVPGMECCRENWPRVGLEAMAAGVPVVAQNAGGWAEMLGGGAGLLCDSVDEQAFKIAMLAYAPQTRLDLILEARRQLENELADPRDSWARWDALFTRLTCNSGKVSIA